MYENEYSLIEKKIENLNLKDSLNFICEFLQKNIIKIYKINIKKKKKKKKKYKKRIKSKK
jgi:hypothetical protein